MCKAGDVHIDDLTGPSVVDPRRGARTTLKHMPRRGEDRS
jgi:hypothetical protein